MSTRPRTILLVSHLPRNLQLLSDLLTKEGYVILTAASYEEFDHVLNGTQAIAGGLVDIAGFDGQIWARCEHLRAIGIPFLIFSPRQSTAIQQSSLSHGAKGVMVKPLIMKELIAVIQTILGD